jgi:hypothetical protein
MALGSNGPGVRLEKLRFVSSIKKLALSSYSIVHRAKRVALISPFSVYINGVELWDREVLFKNLRRMKRRENP